MSAKELLHGADIAGEAVEFSDDVDGAVFAGQICAERFDLHALDVELDQNALGVGADDLGQGAYGDLQDVAVGLIGVEAALVGLADIEGDAARRA